MLTLQSNKDKYNLAQEVWSLWYLNATRSYLRFGCMSLENRNIKLINTTIRFLQSQRDLCGVSVKLESFSPCLQIS